MSTTPENPQPGSQPDHSRADVQPAAPGVAARAGDAAKTWLRRGIGVVAVIAVLVGVYFALAAIVPRWWAERLGRIIDGSMSKGVGLGLLIGVLCTAIPLLLLIFAARKIRSSPGISVVGAVLAIVLAIPNLLTLTIVLGNGNAAHAGERILDVDGPMFRGASAVGAVIGALLAIAIPIGSAVWVRKRAQRKIEKAADKAATKQAKADAKAAAKAEKQAQKSGGDGQ